MYLLIKKYGNYLHVLLETARLDHLAAYAAVHVPVKEKVVFNPCFFKSFLDVVLPLRDDFPPVHQPEVPVQIRGVRESPAALVAPVAGDLKGGGRNL